MLGTCGVLNALHGPALEEVVWNFKEITSLHVGFHARRPKRRVDRDECAPQVCVKRKTEVALLKPCNITMVTNTALITCCWRERMGAPGWKVAWNCVLLLLFFNSRRHKYLRNVSSVVTFPLNYLPFTNVKVLYCIANHVLSIGSVYTVFISYKIIVVVHTKWNFTHALGQTAVSEHLMSWVCIFFLSSSQNVSPCVTIGIQFIINGSKTESCG